jgi:hypothetical protein
MNTHKENLHPVFQQTKGISERGATFYIEKFLQENRV